MIKKINSFDDSIREYIYSDPYFNTYIISDIEFFGLNSEVISIYIGYYNNDIKYVLMKYGNSFVIFSKSVESINLEELAVFFNKFSGEIIISGKRFIVERLSKIFLNSYCSNNKFAILTSDKMVRYSIENTKYKVIKKPSIESVRLIYSQIDEYSEKYFDKEIACERIKRNLLNGRYYGIEYNKNLVSIVSASAESKDYAMISEVGTLYNFRNQGLSKIIVSQLCYDLFCENKKILSIFYHNNIAGKVYDKIGFEKIGEYSLLKTYL